MIGNGPSRLGASFLLSCRSFKYFDSNQTLAPFLNGVNPLVVLSIIFCLASLCAAFACFLASCNDSSRSCVAGMFVIGYAVGMEMGLYPIWRKSGASL